MLGYRTTSALLSFFVVCVILWLIRKDHLHPRKALGWLLLSISIGFIGMFPKTADWMAEKLGVDYAPTLVFVVGLMLVFIKLLRIDAEQSKEDRRLAAITQRLVVLEARFEKYFDSKNEK